MPLAETGPERTPFAIDSVPTIVAIGEMPRPSIIVGSQKVSV